METPIETVALAQLTVSNLAHASHDSHTQNHVDRVSKLDPNFGQARARRTHQIWNHVHPPAAHGALAEAIKLAVDVSWSGPISCGSGFISAGRAYIRALFDACDIVNFRSVVITTRPLFVIQRNQDPAFHSEPGEKFLFRHRPVAPKNLFRLANLSDSFDPGDNALVLRVSGARRGVAHAVSSFDLERTIVQNAIQDHFGIVHSPVAFPKNKKGLSQNGIGPSN